MTSTSPIPRLRTVLAAAFLVCAAFVQADDKKPDGPKADPKGTPLEMRIKGKATYALEKGAAEEYLKFAEARKDPEKARGVVRIPPTPKIELTLEILNTSDKPIKIHVGGDDTRLLLTLKGEGALNLEGQSVHTEEYRMPVTAEIAAGKTISIPLSMSSGFRGDSNVAYWTAAGDYELVATLESAASPKPDGAKDGGEGFGRITLTSAAFPVKVEMAK